MKTKYDIRNTQYSILFIACCILIATCILAGCRREMPEVDVSVNGKAAMIMDARNGRVLFEKASKTEYPPASTAKVMTAIVAIESMPLDGEITPGKKAVYVEPTVAGLKAGVSYKLEDLIAAILIKSANDAAVAIAEGVSGSEERFAELMNIKAKDIGMNDTYFANASGLPTGKQDKQYTTAHDLAIMMRYALRYEIIIETMSKPEMKIFGSDGREIYLKTHNKALLKEEDASWGKTGYTREARRTFAGVDPSADPHVVFSLLKSNDLWKDIRTLKNDGLVLYYLSRRTRLGDLIGWIKGQREQGRTDVEEAYH